MVVGDRHSVSAVHMQRADEVSVIGADWNEDPEDLGYALDQLTAYFAGELKLFELPLTMRGTEFQKRVWTELSNIPFGETVSYSTIAKRIGMPTASRAVGMANAKNPIAIVVPCHRVIGASGTLTGYAGGLDRKRWLLAHEGWEPQVRQKTRPGS